MAGPPRWATAHSVFCEVPGPAGPLALSGFVRRPYADALFLRYYTVVDRPFEATESECVKGAENWMPFLAWEANGHGMRLLSELGFKVGGRRIGKRIELDVREPLRMSGLTLLPIRWRAATKAGLFPALDGQIEIAALGRTATQVV